MNLLNKRVLGLRLRTWGIAPLLAWASINLFFSTAIGTEIVCKKIERKTGLPCKLKSVTWSPWMGVTVSKLQVFVPADLGQKNPLFSVGEIRIDVSWLSLLKGKRRWDRLEVNQLDVNVAIETVREIIAMPTENSSKSVVLQGQPDQDERYHSNPEGQSADEKTEQSPLVPSDVPSKVDRPNVIPMPIENFEGEIIVSNAKVRIFSERVSGLSLTLDQIEGEIPLWGSTRKGEISCGEISLSEEISEVGLTIPVMWEDRSLAVMEHSLKVFGLNLELSAAVKLAAGVPVGLHVSLPDQPVDLSSVFREQKSPFSVSNLTSKNRLQGYLLAPSTFKGSSITNFENVMINDPRDEGGMRFNRGVASFVATAAGVVAKDVRAIGEEDAILINGFATAAGEAAATVRIVSSPERAQSHAKRVRIAPRNLLMDFQPLNTPDRLFRDIHFEARDGTLMMDLGEDRSWVPFFDTAEEVLGGQNTDLPNLP